MQANFYFGLLIYSPAILVKKVGVSANGNHKLSDLCFFIFTFKGNVTGKVDFDTKYWEELLGNLNWFWRKFIAPEILTNKLKSNMTRIVDDKHLVAVPYITSNHDDDIAHNKLQKKVIFHCLIYQTPIN